MKKISSKQSEKGTTLIELLLYIGLISLLLTVAVNLFLDLGEFNLAATSQQNINNEANLIVARLTYDIHQATSISSPANLGDSSSVLIFNAGTDTHTYSLTSGNLQYQSTSSATQSASVNSNRVSVTALSFSRVGNPNGKPTIEVNFTLQNSQPTKQGSLSGTFDTVVGQR